MAAWITHGEMDAINPVAQSERSRDFAAAGMWAFFAQL